MACPLPYPEKFHACVAFAFSPPEGASGITDETRLLLFALYSQATSGPCAAPKPWGMFATPVESAKWEAWNHLGQMNGAEAMRLYVKTMEQENSKWWSLLTKGGDAEAVRLVSEAATRAAQESMFAAAARAAKEQEKKAPEKAAVTDAKGVESAKQSAPTASAFSRFFGNPSSARDAPKAVSEEVKELDAEVAKAKLAPKPVSRLDGLEKLDVRMCWARLATSGPRPVARYMHAAAVCDHTLYVFGGNQGGRSLADVHALDLGTMAWSRLECTGESPAPTTGACLVASAGKLYAVGGYTRAGDEAMRVYELDLASRNWTELCKGDSSRPKARSGHSATLVGEDVYVFGGQDARRHNMSDVYMLSLAGPTWHKVETEGDGPSPRSGHVATAVDEGKTLLVYGGSVSDAAVDGRLFSLDLQELKWVPPAVAGALPSKRGGHAAAREGNMWYVVGGGDGRAAAVGTAALETAAGGHGVFRWRIDVTDSKASAQLGGEPKGEGVSMCAVESGGGAFLVAFGGYDGAFSSDLYACRVADRAQKAPSQPNTHADLEGAAGVKKAPTTAAEAQMTAVPAPKRGWLFGLL